MATANLASMKTNQSAPAVAAANHPILAKTQFLEKRKDLLGQGIPGHMTVEREIRTATVMLMQSKDLQAATPDSFYVAVSVAINSGIGLGNGKGYLVAYKGNCQYVPGWKGLVDLINRSGRASVWTGIVRKGDHFRYQLGDSPMCEHMPGDSESFKDITHFYAIGRVKGSEWPIVEVWSIGKVKKHLNDYNKVGARHYALKDDNNFEMYGRKVVLLQAIKYLPTSQELDNAVAADTAHDSGREMTIEGNMVFVDESDNTQPPADNAPQGNAGQRPAAQPRNEDPLDPADYDDQAAARPAARQQAQSQQEETPAESLVDKLKNRLRTLTDVDMLDAEADLINDIGASPADIEDLREIYQARRHELQEPRQQRPQQQRASRPAMNME